MSEPRPNSVVFLGTRPADDWAQDAMARLASVFTPLTVTWLGLGHGHDATRVQWGREPGPRELPNVWRHECDACRATVNSNGEGAFSLTARFSGANGELGLEAAGEEWSDASAGRLASSLPSVATTVALFCLLLDEHEALVTDEARVRQLRNEQRILKARHTELINDLMVEQELRIAQTREMASRVEAKVDARTAHIARAKERAEQNAQIRGQLLTRLGQELRAPLAALQHRAASALERPDDLQEYRTFLETAHADIQSLLRLIEDVLNASGLMAGEPARPADRHRPEDVEARQPTPIR